MLVSLLKRYILFHKYRFKTLSPLFSSFFSRERERERERDFIIVYEGQIWHMNDETINITFHVIDVKVSC